MDKKCENCKYFKSVPGSFSWCSHKEHAGALVPGFTVCADHELKHKTSGPLDGLKFYLDNAETGKLRVAYICEDCGREMAVPALWWYVPMVVNGKPSTNVSYHFRCEECSKKNT